MSRVIRRGLVGVVAATLATVGLAGTASSASADVDATAPTLALPAYPSFVVGTTVTASDKLDTGEFSDYNDYTYGIAQQVTWSAADASGVCSQAVAETGTGYDFGSTAVDAPAYRYSADDYDDSYGGGMGVSGVDVTVRDCAGNETVGHSGGQPAVYDERVATNRYGTSPTAAHGARSCARGPLAAAPRAPTAWATRPPSPAPTVTASTSPW